ncbi:MAG: hypothetical protein ACTHOH_05405 [Lysobacteraceae bacterium]
MSSNPALDAPATLPHPARRGVRHPALRTVKSAPNRYVAAFGNVWREPGWRMRGTHRKCTTFHPGTAHHRHPVRHFSAPERRVGYATRVSQAGFHAAHASMLSIACGAVIGDAMSVSSNAFILVTSIVPWIVSWRKSD